MSACSPSVGDYPRELEEAFCKWRHACHAYERVGDCIDAETIDRDPEYDYLARAVAAGTVEYDADAAADCLDAMRERSCDRESPEPEACARVFRGRVTANGPCLSARECAGDAVCGFPPNCRAEDPCCVGACRVFAPPLAVGEACNFGGTQCAPEAYCAVDPMTAMPTVCTARVEAGGDCSLGQQCVEAARCDGEKCREVELRQPGEPCDGEFVGCAEPGSCDYNGEDAGPVCVVAGGLGAPCEAGGCARSDTFCDGASGLCTLLPGPGQGCGNTFECLPYADCDGGFYDEYGEQMGDPVCRARAGLGDACIPGGIGVATINCLGDLQCDENGRCVLPPLTAEQCEIPVDDL